MFLLLGLLGGFITGISPCILPVLPALFLGAAGRARLCASSRTGRGRPLPPRPLTKRRRAWIRRSSISLLGVNLGGEAPKKAAVAAQSGESVTPPGGAHRPGPGDLTFMLITVAGSALLSLLNLPQALIRWTGIVLLVAVIVGMIVPRSWKCFACGRPANTYDGTARRAETPASSWARRSCRCAGPVLTLDHRGLSSGQITWHIIGLAVSFAIGVSIPLIVAIAGSAAAS